MKTLIFLKHLTFIEICLNLILAVIFNVAVFTNRQDLAAQSFTAIAILHTTSMVLHWVVWKQLPTTHKERTIFNIWVAGTFLLVFIVSKFEGMALFLMLYLLLYSSLGWFIFYCYILFKEYKFLKRKKELYDQRELIHF